MKTLFLTPLACLIFMSTAFAQGYPPYRYVAQQTEGSGVAEPEVSIPQQATTTHSVGPLNSTPATSGTPTLASSTDGGQPSGSTPPTTFQNNWSSGAAAIGPTPSGNVSTGPVAAGAARVETTAPAQAARPPYAAAPRVVPAATPAPVVVYRPVLPVFRMPRSYVVGRGILGQPKVYVPGQPVRNTLRWLTP